MAESAISPRRNVRAPDSAREKRRERSPFGGFRLGSIAGVEIRVDASLLVVFALIATNLGGAVLPSWHPEWSRSLTWGVALAAAVLFFASVLLHELSHAVVARANDISVHRITLFLFGGIAHMESQPPSPKSEFLMAIVGPITSAAIGIVALLVASVLTGPTFSAGIAGPELAAKAMHDVAPLPTLLLWLGPVNLMLALFNLVPGFPLDGGRVFRSIVWAITGDVVKATRWASGAGQLFAWFLMAMGIVNVFSGAMLNGIWLLVIGWFLSSAARVSYQQLLVRQALEDVPVERVMRTRFDRVDPDLPLEDFVREHLMTTDQHAFPVEQHGRFVGLVCFDDVRKVPQWQWASTPVGHVMTPSERLATLSLDAAAADALEQLANRDVDQIPVVQGKRLVGMVRRRDLMRWLALQNDGIGPIARQPARQ